MKKQNTEKCTLQEAKTENRLQNNQIHDPTTLDVRMSGVAKIFKTGEKVYRKK